MKSNYLHQWRITKYNPTLRDEDGTYLLKDEWTSCSDIGKLSSGKEFTLDEYLKTEQAYVNAVMAFMAEEEIRYLRVVQLNQHEMDEEEKQSPLYKEFTDIIIQEDMAVMKEDIPTLLRMLLREYIHCQLLHKDNFFIHIGYDYYMYIGSTNPSLKGIAVTKELGLFVEEMESPYYVEERDIERVLQWSLKGEDEIVSEEELNVPLALYRSVFGLSEEHPITGVFKVESPHIKELHMYIKHECNFDRYDYSIAAM